MSELCIISGTMGGQSFALKKNVTTIGRSGDNDLRIADRSISRAHAMIIKKTGKFYVKDLNSYNGTVVDGRPVKAGEKVQVRKGSTIVIGDVFMSLGEPDSLDGMITQYSMDLTTQIDKENLGSLYKDSRITNRKKLEVIYEVATVLMQSLSLQELSERIIESLFSCLERIDAASIILVDTESGELKEMCSKSRTDGPASELKYSKTIVDRVVQEGQAVMMSDVTADNQAVRSETLEVMRVKSVMCVPLICRSRTRGVIYVHSCNRHQGFTKDDLFLFTGLSTPAALAVENALLYTHTKRAFHALRESEEKYRILLDNANDAVFITQEGSIKFPNPKAVQVLGYSPDELLGIPFDELIHPEDRYLVLQRQGRSLEEKGAQLTDSFRIRNSHHEELWVQVNAAAVTWEGRPAELNILRDITPQKKMEAQLIHAQKMEAMGTLAGGIAHDFNNILSAILGYAELTALDLADGTKPRENLEQVIHAGNRAKELVQEILTFSRQQDHQRKMIHVGPLIKETLKLLRASLPSTIEIRSTIPKDIGAVEADPSQIHQVIMNLCTNAFHAMREKGGVLDVTMSHFELEPGDALLTGSADPVSFIKITVSDTGHGMNKEVMARIFDPYYTTKDPGEGTGLGLAVVHGIVKSLGGAVTVQSTPGKGSIFTVHLPLVKKQASATPDETPEPAPSGREHILFVDDEPALVGMAKQVLQRLGYEVHGYTNSTEALEAFRLNRSFFDLVITDMTMPQMTGDKLAKEIMGIRPEMPVILCTGHSEKITEEKTKKLGIAAFLRKPLKLQEFAKKIRTVLDDGRRQ